MSIRQLTALFTTRITLDRRRPNRPSDRRRQSRLDDGAATEIGADGSVGKGRILDVSGEGMRIFSERRLTLGGRVTCRVRFTRRMDSIGLSPSWEREVEGGFEYGCAHAPLVPGTSFLLDNYYLRIAVLRERLAA